MNTLTNIIDRTVAAIGRVSSFTVYPLVIIVIFEVIMRYVFDAPTVWAFEATGFAYGIHYMFGLSFMENANGHVKVDILTSRLSPKKQALFGAVTYAAIFMPLMVLMVIGATKFAWTSTMQGELNSTSWAPPVWPYKIIMAFTFLLLLLQGFSTFLKHLQTLTKKEVS